MKRPKPPNQDEGLFCDEKLTALFGSAEEGARILGIASKNIVRPELTTETPRQDQELQEEELGKAATTVFCWLYGITRSACGKGKIQPEHLPTLQALEKDPQANLTDLGKKVGVHPTTVKRQMDVLQKNGVGAVRAGRVKKKKAMIAEIIPAGRQELSRYRSRIGSELKGSLERPSCDCEEFSKALGRLVAIAPN